MESLVQDFQSLQLEPQYLQLILEKKERIKGSYYEYVFRTADDDTPRFLSGLHMKWIQAWQTINGTGYLLLMHPYNQIQTLRDLFQFWDQICVYYNLTAETILQLYNLILDDIESTNAYLMDYH